MNSRERVLTVFSNEEPDRVPMWCGASQEFWAKAKHKLSLNDEQLRQRFHDDFRRVYGKYSGPPINFNRTIFGIERDGMGYGQPVNHPLACATLQQIHDYQWPNPNWIDVSDIPQQAKDYAGQYAILGGDWSPFWHDAIDLLGMETLLIKMYTEPQVVDTVLNYIVDYYVAVNTRLFDIAAENIDIFFIGNDFGSQTGPLVGEPLFKRFLLPHLKKLIDLGHAYNLKVMLHCCGAFVPLIPAMIDVGLDALHALQPCCHGMDLAELKSNFGKKIVFNGGIDSHHVLIEGLPDFVQTSTIETLKIMMPCGGYIAGASHDTILEETPVENVLTMFDTILEFGKYAKE